MKPAVLAIRYNGKLYPQGKYVEIEGKKLFIANIDKQKLFRNYNGYGIAKEILDAFSELHSTHVIILYREIGKKRTYAANPCLFTSKGILVAYGGHEQWVLPLKNWKVYEKDFTKDPKDLPIISVSTWKIQNQMYSFEGNKAIAV